MDWECDGYECCGFEADEYDASGELEEEPLYEVQFVPLPELDPKTRMIVGLFLEGPPEGCRPWLN